MEPSYYCYLVSTISGAAMLHMKGCAKLDKKVPRIFLGSVYKSYQALSLARRLTQDVSACPYCMVK